MKQDVLQKAHLLYELEGGRVARLLEEDPTYAGLLERLAQAEHRLAGSDRAGAEAMAEARRLLLEMTRETSFKMGFLMAHDYPLEEVFKL
ncbi:MAG: hypothetical protein KJ720_17685 [Proteobacteria bacterium]|nr:hypothetical protein [Pseudomonadota bacterium]MBU1451031.1 hypothetical protein [Pseudomonadota bacterium]MBU2467840.1 hypothetical protein [Pseudomonadota bacterium]MBU2517624.1 hypothetical protein [Pseudomonadota bacterium]